MDLKSRGEIWRCGDREKSSDFDNGERRVFASQICPGIWISWTRLVKQRRHPCLSPSIRELADILVNCPQAEIDSICRGPWFPLCPSCFFRFEVILCLMAIGRKAIVRMEST